MEEETIVITRHASFQMKRRGVSDTLVRETLSAPDQVVEAKKGRSVYQKKDYEVGPEKEMLVRVVVEKSASVFRVVTVYKTSKIEKYWRSEGPR